MRGRIWWLASYPKSGNTWVRLMLARLLSDVPLDINNIGFLGVSAAARADFDRALGISSAELDELQIERLRPRAYELWSDRAATRLYSKVHDRYGITCSGEPIFSRPASAGAIYILRDPRAVAVSFAHHLSLSIDATIDIMENRRFAMAHPRKGLPRHLVQPLGTWSEHVKSWTMADLPMLVLRYEDMIADPVGTVAALAARIGVPCNAERAEAVVEATRFDRLQEQERRQGFIERPPRAATFFREGRAYGWRDVLSPSQQERICAAHGPIMTSFGYE